MVPSRSAGFRIPRRSSSRTRHRRRSTDTSPDPSRYGYSVRPTGAAAAGVVDADAGADADGAHGLHLGRNLRQIAVDSEDDSDGAGDRAAGAPPFAFALSAASSTSGRTSASMTRRPDLVLSWLRSSRTVSRLASTSSVPPLMKPATRTRRNADTSIFGERGVSIGTSKKLVQPLTRRAA